jgi:hypothetical protein
VASIVAVAVRRLSVDRHQNAAQTVGMSTQHPGGGWVSYTDGPGGVDHLAPDVRAKVERLEAARKERLGRLLCEVHVRVYEHDDEAADMYVSFPDDAALGPDSDRGEVAAAVAIRADESRMPC